MNEEFASQYIFQSVLFSQLRSVGPSGYHSSSTRHVTLEIGILDKDERGRELRKTG